MQSQSSIRFLLIFISKCNFNQALAVLALRPIWVQLNFLLEKLTWVHFSEEKALSQFSLMLHYNLNVCNHYSICLKFFQRGLAIWSAQTAVSAFAWPKLVGSVQDWLLLGIFVEDWLLLWIFVEDCHSQFV